MVVGVLESGIHGHMGAKTKQLKFCPVMMSVDQIKCSSGTGISGKLHA